MDTLMMVGQFILGLSLLVGLHELGHMLTAKWFGMRVEKYAIGFPPKILSKKIGETEYMIGAIPLGGFVKITGMIDESLDTEAMKEEPKPYEFRAKPPWQRLIVMMGGIIVNVISGILIFILLVYIYGETYLPIKEAKHGIVATNVGKQIGLQDGDKIFKINGKTIQEFEEIFDADLVLDSKKVVYTIERSGQVKEIEAPQNLIGLITENKEPVAQERARFMVDTLKADSPAGKAGIKPKDKIIRVENQDISYYDELQKALLAHAGKPTNITIERGNQRLQVRATLNGPKDSKGILGFKPKFDLNYKTRYFSFAESIPLGAQKAFNIIVLNIKGFGKIFSGEVKAGDALSGPIGIMNLFGGTWVMFWTLVGMLSMVLAFMNFLPIPALDGGHVMFLTYEMISGQKPSDSFLENSQKVGMFLLLGLMVYAVFNDVSKISAVEKFIGNLF